MIFDSLADKGNALESRIPIALEIISLNRINDPFTIHPRRS